MNYKKILMAAIAVMMIFSIAPLASAGSGLTEDDPIEILYIGWQWEYGGMNGTSMGHFPGATDYWISDYVFEMGGVWFKHTYLELDTFNDPYFGNLNGSFWAADYNLLIVDMFFSETMNSWNTYFLDTLEANFENSSTLTVSIFSEDYLTGESAAPLYFDVRDTPADTVPSVFSETFFEALDESEASVLYADWDMYTFILSEIVDLL